MRQFLQAGLIDFMHLVIVPITQARACWVVAAASLVKRRPGDTRIVPRGRASRLDGAEAGRALIGPTVPDGVCSPCRIT